MEETKLMTLEEVAKYLGLSMHTIYVMARNNELPTITLGERSLRVKLSDLDAWLEARKTGKE